jgi:hypothetical protein
MPDAAVVLVAACREADVPLEQHTLESGELQNLFEARQQQIQKFNAGESPGLFTLRVPRALRSPRHTAHA